MTRFLNVAALALCLGSASFANTDKHESLDVPFELLSGSVSSLDLLIDGNKSFDIISPGGLNYDSGTGTVFFDINGPLFCFEFADDFLDPALRLSVEDANGDIILDAFRLNSPLQYNLGTNEIVMNTPASAACFYDGADDFGLEGQPPLPPLDDGDRIFGDRLEGRSNLLIEFIDVPQFVRVDEVVSYSIRVSNLGNRDVNNVGFQELYPRNPVFFPEGQLISGFYQCVGSNGGQCADATPGTNEPSIRGQNISLPVGGSVRFNVNRAVFSDSQIGGTITLRAGAIAGDMGEIPPAFDAKTINMTVIGEGQTLSAEMVNSAPPVANGSDQAIIEVTALDDNKNPTPDVFVEVVNVDGLSISPASGTTGADGKFTFLANTIGNGQAGSFMPEFGAPDLQNDGVTTVALVEFVAGDPDQIFAATTVDNAIANGTDPGIVQIEILDAFDNPVPGAEVSVQAADSLNFAATSVLTDSNGIAEFSATSVNSGTFNPVFSAAGIVATATSPVSFVPGDPAQLAFVVQPSDTGLGSPISPAVVIEVQDADGNRVSSDNESDITVRLRQNNLNIATLVSFEPVINGQLELGNLIMAIAGQDFSLRASADNIDFGITSAESTLFDVLVDDLAVNLNGFDNAYSQGQTQSGSETVAFTYTNNAGNLTFLFNVFRVFDTVTGQELTPGQYQDMFANVAFGPAGFEDYIRGLSGQSADNVVAPATVMIDVLFELGNNAPIGNFELTIASYDVSDVDPQTVTLEDAIAGVYGAPIATASEIIDLIAAN